MLVFAIILCIIPVLLALYVQRNARRRLALTPEHPDKPYDTSDHYVIGGRWGFSPLTGELGYESYKFADAMTATYICSWLNNAHDHRSLGMAFYDWAARAEADREVQRKADLDKIREVHAYDPCYCTSCDRYIDRATAARTMSYIRSGRCTDCEMAHHERQLIATFQVPGAMIDVVQYVPGLETPYHTPRRASKFTASSGPK